MHDLVIRGGAIVDGTGSPRCRADADPVREHLPTRGRSDAGVRA
jgi:hypothetical protein